MPPRFPISSASWRRASSGPTHLSQPVFIECFPTLERIPGLAHGLTTRAGGSSRGPFQGLNLGLTTGDDRDTVLSNRRLAAAALGFEDITFLEQVHGRRVVCLDRMPATPEAADGTVTDRPGLLAGVLGADCPGVLLVHPERRALAVVHAGWRGVVAQVVAAAIDTLARRYGAAPDALHAAIGPAISAPRYEVTTDVAVQVRSALAGADERLVARTILAGRPGHAHVDLVQGIRAQLLGAGVTAERVAVHGDCTFGKPESWFSHRRDGARTGRHALLAGWTR